MARKMKSLEKSLKNIHGVSGQKSVSYSDLCMFPYVHFPAGFKMPKFKKYDRHRDPIAHLKRYCNQLRGAGGKEQLLMAYFGESLKSTECFRNYTAKWHEQATRVKPLIDKTDMVTIFLQAQATDYFENMMSAIGKTFAEAINIGEIVENGLKIGHLLSHEALKSTSQAIWNGSGGLANRKKREEGVMMASSSTLVPQDIATKAERVSAKDLVFYIPKAPRKEHFVLSTPKKFDEKKFTLNVPRLYVPKGIHVVRGPIISPRLTEPMVINLTPQRPMKDPNTVLWNYNITVVTYKGKEIIGEVNEITRSGRYYTPDEMRKAKQNKDNQMPPKKLVRNEEAEEFFNKMITSDYSTVDQLQKTPSQISLLSLLLRLDEHQKIFLKTLNIAYFPVETTVAHLERMAETFFEFNKISFSRDDFPAEGVAHNKVLHLTVKYEGYYVKRVMLDGGSGVDICPISTLQRMEIDTERIRANNVYVRAFNGVKRDKIGEIDLVLTIVPVDFEVTFHVLDMETSYNFLLGRPWIHAVGAIPSTLHQMVKFKYDNQEIIVHGEDEQSIYRDPSVLCFDAREVVLKTLYEAYFPVETIAAQLERMSETFFEVNKISCNRDDLPAEGVAHNKALHLTVKYEGYYVKRVTLDGESGVDICPPSMLQRIEIDIEIIWANNVCVRAFNRVKRDTIGEIDLVLTIVPVDFEVTFQVLDMETSYNYLLGRP
ncbi:uncharacterized protein [Nicotiana tomentosiformis]|uniref:uncharacterized protein n=1 Tax=Nicotiana tomentosiformis TaxID=4098 RepID=UPI00388C6DCA